MTERGFHDVDVRAMLDDATGMEEQPHGTFAIETVHAGSRWKVILSPDDATHTVIVVTAYAVDEG